MKRIHFIFLAILIMAPSAWAHPLITEEVQPVGFLNFQGGMFISYRRDSFGSPTQKYETVNFPVELKFGVHRKAEIGLDLAYLFHKTKLEQSNDLSGSSNANLTPSFKYSPWEYLGFRVLWHIRKAEKAEDEFPIARGDDIEFLQLFKIPVPYGAAHINTGYLWRDSYQSNLGIRAFPKSKVEPGNIFESRASWEIPTRWNLNLLSEVAYYRTGKQKIEGVTIANSDGEAMDALGGLTWAYQGWNLSAGVAFGLLDESHTSFNLERGAGDWQTLFRISYMLMPRKPGQ